MRTGFVVKRFTPVLAGLLMVAGCGTGPNGTGSGGGTNEKEFVIGLAAPLTGDSSEFGAQIKQGVELYAEQLNAKGGIEGRKLRIDEQDDAGKADQAQNVATTLASDNSVLAVIGHFNSSCSLAGKGTYSQAKMVMFSPGSTNVDVTKGSDYVFRNIFTDAFQGESLATYAAKVLGKKNAAIMYDNDDYGTGLKDSFRKKAKELGMNIATELAYNKDAPDFRSQLTTIRSLQPQPDILLVAGLYTQAANIARQARDLGLKTQIIGGDGCFSDQYIKLAGSAAEGSFITCPFLFDLGGAKAKEFAEAFKKKYQRDPDAWAALSYDAMSMVCEGIKKHGFTRDAVLKYLQGLDSPAHAYVGVVGKTFFDKEGDCRRPVQVAEVKNGKFIAASRQLEAESPAQPTKPATPKSDTTTSSSAAATTTPR